VTRPTTLRWVAARFTSTKSGWVNKGPHGSPDAIKQTTPWLSAGAGQDPAIDLIAGFIYSTHSHALFFIEAPRL
jgi:hypothetical protein